MARPIKLRDFTPEAESLLEEVVTGLQQPQKELPPKLFYDEYGSQLFDRITRLPEYYPTRTETAIMEANIDEIAALIGPGTMLIEYGSGSSTKTRVLLDHLTDLIAYVPIDISKDHLMESAARIAAAYPAVEVLPVAADYTDRSFKIPAARKPISHRVIFYPGSSIGNFHPHEAVEFLRRMTCVVGLGGGVLLGVDLKKDPALLHRAYNDSSGATAEFNLNILTRINNELGTQFDLDRFRHRAIYNKALGRIEMHLVSLGDQIVDVGDTEIHFATGETIWTESSYKYAVDEFAGLALEAGLEVARVWRDADDLFSVQYLTVLDSPDA